MSPAPIWRPLEEAPQDGTPVFARGHSYGKPECGIHCCWAYFNDGQWFAADSDNAPLAYVTEYLVRPEPAPARIATPNGAANDLLHDAMGRN